MRALKELAAKAKQVLVPDHDVAIRYGVTVRTLERWDLTEGLNFPPPVWICERRYRPLAALDKWDRENARRSAAHKSRTSPQYLPRSVQRPRKPLRDDINHKRITKRTMTQWYAKTRSTFPASKASKKAWIPHQRGAIFDAMRLSH